MIRFHEDEMHEQNTVEVFDDAEVEMLKSSQLIRPEDMKPKSYAEVLKGENKPESPKSSQVTSNASVGAAMT